MSIHTIGMPSGLGQGRSPGIAQRGDGVHDGSGTNVISDPETPTSPASQLPPPETLGGLRALQDLL